MSQLLTSNNQQSSYAATWNDAATVFTAWKLNVTDTASNASSLLLDLQVGGANRFRVTKTGQIFFGASTEENNYITTNRTGASVICLSSDGPGSFFIGPLNNYIVAARMLTSVAFRGDTPISFSSGAANTNTIDISIWRDAAGILAQRNGTNTQAFRLYRTYTDSSNYEALELAHATYSTKQYSILRTITAGTGDDSINLVLQPAGNGGIMARLPDGTTTGGNARGAYAIDLQCDPLVSAIEVASGNSAVAIGSRNRSTGDRSVALGYANLASGNRSFAAGEGNTASGGLAVAMGRYCTASATESACIGGYNQATGTGSFAWGSSTYAASAYSTAGGLYSKSDKQGQFSTATGRFAVDGDAQRSVLVMRNATTDATVTELFLDGTSLRATIPNNTLWHADIRIAARQATGTNHAIYHRKCAIYKNTTAGSTALQGTVQTIGTDVESDANWDVTVSADTTNGSLKIEVTGVAATNIRWVAEVSLVEVAYA